MAPLKAFLRNETAATAIEYAMIAAFVSVLIVTGARAIGVSVSNLFLQPLATNLT